MAKLTPEALSVLWRQHGVITSSDLVSAGVSRNTRHRLIDAGELIQIHRSVYRLPSAPDTLGSRCAALALAHPSGFITGPTAAMLLGLRRMPRSSSLHLAVPHGLRIDQPAGVRLRQSTKISAIDRVSRSDGITIASSARLAFDLAADLNDLDHASVVEQLLSSRLCTVDELSAMGDRLVHVKRPGSIRFSRTLASRVPGGPADSHWEVRLATALVDRGLPVVRQYRATLADGRHIRLDLALPLIRWGVEIDVHPEHLLLDGTTKDKRRDRDLHRHDWQIERVSELDLVDFDLLADELTHLAAARTRMVELRGLASQHMRS